MGTAPNLMRIPSYNIPAGYGSVTLLTPRSTQTLAKLSVERGSSRASSPITAVRP